MNTFTQLTFTTILTLLLTACGGASVSATSDVIHLPQIDRTHFHTIQVDPNTYGEDILAANIVIDHDEEEVVLNLETANDQMSTVLPLVSVGETADGIELVAERNSLPVDGPLITLTASIAEDQVSVELVTLSAWTQQETVSKFIGGPLFNALDERLVARASNNEIADAGYAVEIYSAGEHMTRTRIYEITFAGQHLVAELSLHNDIRTYGRRTVEFYDLIADGGYHLSYEIDQFGLTHHVELRGESFIGDTVLLSTEPEVVPAG